MKTKVIALLSFLVVSISLFAQINTVRDGSVNYKDGSRYCIEFEVEAVEKEVIGAWKKHLKKNHKVKLKKYLGGTYMEEQVVFEKVSNKTIDVLTIANVKDTTTVVKVFIGFGFDVYMNATDHATEVGRLKTVVQSFLTEFVEAYYDSVLKPMLKKESKISKELAKTEKEIAKADKNLKKNKSSIEKNNTNISKYQSKIDKYNEKIGVLNTDIEENTKANDKLTEENSIIEDALKISETEKEKAEKELNAVKLEIQKVQSKK